MSNIISPYFPSTLELVEELRIVKRDTSAFRKERYSHV